jgi:hypothetical protein
MQIGVAEFLDKVSKLRKTQEKIDAIKANDSPVLRMILQGCYDPNVVWDLPPGNPPYKPSDLVDQEHILIHESRKIPYFIKGFREDIPRAKKETMWIELLESVSPKDAELLCAIKEKKPLKGITTQHVTEGLPGLIPNEQESQKVS